MKEHQTMQKQLSDAELEIMKVIWNAKTPLLFAEITKALAEHGRDWQKNTLITLLSRLIQKGFLSTDKHGRKNIYTPCITEHDFQTVQTKHFVDRVFQGKVSGLVTQLVQSDSLTEDEYEQLKKILEDK